MDLLLEKEIQIKMAAEALGWFPMVEDAKNNLALIRQDAAPFTDKQFSTHRVLVSETGQIAFVSGCYDLTLSEGLESLADRRACNNL